MIELGILFDVVVHPRFWRLGCQATPSYLVPQRWLVFTHISFALKGEAGPREASRERGRAHTEMRSLFESIHVLLAKAEMDNSAIARTPRVHRHTIQKYSALWEPLPRGNPASVR